MPRRYSKALLFFLSLVAVACLWKLPYLLAVIELCIALGILRVSGWGYWKYFVVCAGLGVVSEVYAIHAGAWSYALPQILGVPLWLPFLWGNAAIFFVSLSPHVAPKGKPS